MKRWHEIQTWERVAGWYIEPATETKYCYVGDDVQLGDDVWLGAGVQLGDYVELGNDVRLGARVRLGDYVELGNDVRLGDFGRLGNGVCLGNDVQLGARVRLGDDVRLGARVRLGDDVSIPVYKSYRYAIHWYSPGTIRAGCLIKPFDWCTANVRQVAAEHGYPPDEQERYAGFVRQIIEWEKIMGDKVGFA